eukprot:516665_1
MVALLSRIRIPLKNVNSAHKKFLKKSMLFTSSKLDCTTMQPAKLDKDAFVNEFDVSILDDDWLPPGPQRTLIYSFHRLLSATNYRLQRSSVLNDGNLSRCDTKLNDINFTNEAGYYRFGSDLKALDRQVRKFTKQSHKMIDKFQNLESNVIPQEFMEWSVKWPPPSTPMISNHWPSVLHSPTYEVGCSWWHCQIRKIRIGTQYKLGVFVGPKQVTQLKDIIALNGKLKVTISVSIQHKDAHHESLEVKTDDIVFHVETNFVKTQDNTTRLITWGKFVPELQDIIDNNTGCIPHDCESVCLSVKCQIIDQCATYKHKPQFN